MDEHAKEKMKKFVEGVHITSEMALIFYRSTLEAGATSAEATRLTQAYLSAIIFGGNGGEDRHE